MTAAVSRLRDYPGACFCGAIGFRFRTAIEPAAWSIRACQCRFCRMHDALSCSDPDGSLEFIADQPGHLQRFRFALKTADFLVCRNCGVYIGAAIEKDGRHYGIINTHALDSTSPALADPRAIVYDGEDIGARVGRRETRWTPVLSVPW